MTRSRPSLAREDDRPAGVSRRGVLAVLLLAGALCGCGRKGGLSLPPAGQESEGEAE